MLGRISLPVQLLLIILLIMLFGGYANENTVRFFYTISILIKQALSFLLPFIIFSFIFSGIVAMQNRAPVVLGVLIVSVFISNSIAALLSYGVSLIFLPHIIQKLCITNLDCAHSIEPFYTFSIPVDICSLYQWFCTTIMPYFSMIILTAGIISGLYASFYSLPMIEKIVVHMRNKLEIFFNYIFIPLLPLYVLGFLLKIQHEGVLYKLIEHYGGAFFLIIIMQALYLLTLYYIATGLNYQATLQAISNASASYLTAFTTMSSTATVPVSVTCAMKNIDNKPLARMAMPIMANIHLLGDSISTPILALVTMMLFLGTVPTLSTYLVFTLYFCFSMFAVSGIPGGGIIVILPVLQTYLGFTPEMTGVMIALYMILDSFGTATNVMGDGALVMIVDKLIKRLKLI